jgi:hypothetical protein
VLQRRGFLTRPEYAPPIRALASLGLVLALLAAGCGDSDSSSQGADTGTTTTAATTTVDTTALDPLEGAGTDPVEGQATGDETALLDRVAVGGHQGFDRIVFQFRNGLPGYQVEYVEPPLKQDGSGNVIQVKGNAYLQVRMEPASGFDVTTGEGELVYKGPKRIDGAAAGSSVVEEVVRLGDFEAVLTWVIGLGKRADFRVSTADNPARLIVDVRNT